MWSQIRKAIMECDEGVFKNACLDANDAIFGDATRIHRVSAFSNILEEAATEEQPDSEIFMNIADGKWDTNGNLSHDYPIFMDSLSKSRHPASLTWYTKNDYANKNANLFKVKGFDAGFAIAGDGDIISVHNNTNIKNVAPALIQKAIDLGGTHLDHYAYPRLNEVYSGAGFQEYNRYDWDDQYAPDNWDYEKNGRPSVIMRGLPSYIETIKRGEAID